MTLTDRTPLSRPRIAQAALALIDDDGLDSLSMRRLGARLGVEAMSLYNHVDNKDDLLGAVVDGLYTEVLEAYGAPTGAWRQKARQMVASYVEVANIHPNATTLLIDRTIDTPQGLIFLDRVVAIFDDVTDDVRVAALAFAVASDWVVGVLAQQRNSASNRADEPLAGLDGSQRVQLFVETVQTAVSPGDRISEGLETVLDGIEVRYLSDGSSR